MSLSNMIPQQQLIGNDLLPSPTIEQQSDEHNASALEDAEDMDTASRPRLTQEQINVLEEHFRHQPKPNTDIKKQLAGEIGLSLQRVNVRRLSELDKRLCCGKMLTLTVELVPKPKGEGQTAEETGGSGTYSFDRPSCAVERLLISRCPISTRLSNFRARFDPQTVNDRPLCPTYWI